jgi:hypothetical protein
MNTTTKSSVEFASINEAKMGSAPNNFYLVGVFNDV